MKKKYFVRITAMFLLVAVMLTLTFTSDSFTAQAGEAKDRYTELQKQLDELNKEIEELDAQADQASSQRDALLKQIDVLKEQISILQGQISEQQAVIVAKQAELDAKKQEMADTEALFKERIRAIYMLRTDGVLSTMMGANTYSEALTASDTMQRITETDTDLLDLLTTQKAEIEQEEAAQQALLDEMEATQSTMDGKMGDLAGSLQQVNTSLSDIAAAQDAAADEYDKLYAEYEEAKAAAEREFIASGDLTEYVGGEFTWPVPGFYRISSPFGWRTLYGKADYHTGTDIIGTYSGAIYGAPIVAANDGYVTVARYGDTGYGICVYIDHGGGVMTRYGHCSSLAVSAGQYVTKGTVIAYAGNSGNSTGPHLHFEIRVNGTAVDAMTYFTAA